MVVRRTTKKNMSVGGAGVVPSAGNVIWVDLSPIRGHEQGGRRPVVVISEHDYTAVSGLCTVTPVTSVIKGYISEVLVCTDVISGAALVNQVRTLDLRSRTYETAGSISGESLAEIRAKLGVILGIYN